MQNLKYLKSIEDNDDRFGVILNKYAVKHSENIQKKIALTLLEYFEGKFIQKTKILQDKNLFYIKKSE